MSSIQVMRHEHSTLAFACYIESYTSGSIVKGSATTTIFESADIHSIYSDKGFEKNTCLSKRRLMTLNESRQMMRMMRNYRTLTVFLAVGNVCAY
jgi:hypothetical protein